MKTNWLELLQTIENSGLSYAQPVLRGEDINKAIELRQAGLGLLGQYGWGP